MAHKITVIVTEEQHRKFVDDLTVAFKVTFSSDGDGNRFWSIGERVLFAGQYIEKFLASRMLVSGSKWTAPVYEYHIYSYI